MPSIFESLGNLGVGVASLAIILTIAFLIMSQGKEQLITIEGNCSTQDGSNCGFGTNATSELQGAVDDIPGWIPLIIIASIGAILLGLVGMFRGR
jgi:hypothetical protein